MTTKLWLLAFGKSATGIAFSTSMMTPFAVSLGVIENGWDAETSLEKSHDFKTSLRGGSRLVHRCAKYIEGADGADT